MPASRNGAGSIGPNAKLNAATRSSSTTASWSSLENGGAKRLTANGDRVRARTRRIASRRRSADQAAPPSEPSAPALDTAAASSGVLTPAIGACTIG